MTTGVQAIPVVDGAGVRTSTGINWSHAVRITARLTICCMVAKPFRSWSIGKTVCSIAKEIDAVLVGGSDALTLEGRKAIGHRWNSDSVSLPRRRKVSTSVYELSLIRDDNHVSLFPLLWHRFDAAVIELKQMLNEGRLGRVQFLQLNRTLSHHRYGMRPSMSTPISQAVVDDELLNDADLLRWLIGDYDQVTGLRTAATSEGVLMQSVVLAGRALPEANWSINPVDGPNQWRLIVRAEGGTG